MRNYFSFIIVFFVLLSTGCGLPRITLFPGSIDPLQEFTLQGKAKGKVLVISIRGNISNSPQKRFIRTSPSLVQEVVSQLRKAEKDAEIKALLLKIDSPGGSVTASDMLYNELVAFKRRTGAKIVVVMMGVAASGGYYIALPADYILAHPTTVTGSIGVIFFRPDVTGLMEKIGVDVDVSKTGKNKDMGSPFRHTTAEEKKITQDLIDQLGKRLLSAVTRHRKLDQEMLKQIATARIYLAVKHYNWV